ncbi:MAG: DNA repair protein RecO [Oceanococcus sp.]
MSLRASAQPAWILHRREYRDSSLILDLLTLDHGRVSVVARGARKAKGGSQLQMFRPLQLDFFLRGELGTLGRFESLGSAIELQGLRLWCGFYCNELLMRMVSQGEPGDTQLFHLYQEMLRALLQRSPAQVLRYFEYRLLELSGFSFDPQLITASEAYVWDPLHGLCASSQGVAGQVLLDLMADGWDAQVESSKPVLASMLHQQLAGKPLKTAVMLRDLVALKQQNAATADAKH